MLKGHHLSSVIMLPFAYQNEFVLQNQHKLGGWEESGEAKKGLQIEAGARFSFHCHDSIKWALPMSTTERWVTHRGSQHGAAREAERI